MRLLRPYDRLVYPGGRLAGFDPSHPAAGPSPIVSCVASQGVPVNLITGHAATLNSGASGVANIDGVIGPNVSYPSGNGHVFSGYAPATPANTTFGAIFRPTASNATGGAIIAYGTSVPALQLALNSLNPALFFFGGTGTSSNGVLTVGVPYFIAVSGNTSVQNFVTVRLDTGAVKIKQNATALTGGGTSTGKVTIGGMGTAGTKFLSGNLAAAMCSGGPLLSIAQLLAWAADPWAFWYPPATRQVLFSGLRTATASPLGAGSFALTGEATPFQTNEIAAGGSFTLTGKPVVFEDFETTLTAGSFTLTGKPSLFETFMASVKGSFTLTGEAATLVAPGARGRAGAIGSYPMGRLPVAGSETKLTTIVLVADVGTFTETGEATPFVLTVPEAGTTYALTGEPAAFKDILGSAFGSYTLTGEDVQFFGGGGGGVAAGSFALTGKAVTFRVGLKGVATTYTLTRPGAPFLGALVGTVQLYTLTGIDAVEVLSIGWRRAMDATTQWLPATKPTSNWTVEAPPVSSWSREP